MKIYLKNKLLNTKQLQGIRKMRTNLIQVIPFQLAKNAEKYLQSKNHPVTLISFEGGHTMPPNYVEIFKKAIDSFSGQKQMSGK